MASRTRLDIEDRVATVTIENPPINAFHPAVSDEIAAHLKTIAAERSVRVVIITGSGSHFVGGADLRYVRTLDSTQAEAYALRIQATQDGIRTLRQPVIAAINGSALGGGAELALACDLRVAEEQAVFGFPEVTLGLIPGAGGTQNLPRLIALGRAKKMIYTGERIGADEALSIGLIDELVPTGEVLVNAKRLAAEIARNAPLAVSAAKRAVDLGMNAGLVEGHRIEAALFGPLVESDDFAEGTAAFFEKRPANFQGN